MDNNEYDLLSEEDRQAIQTLASVAFLEIGPEHVSIDNTTGNITLDPWLQGKVVYNTTQMKKALEVVSLLLSTLKTVVTLDCEIKTPRLVSLLLYLDRLVTDLPEEELPANPTFDEFSKDDLN